jgi:dihydrolipoamide dehydrogenase
MSDLDQDRTEWDVVVIGGGPPGENAAQYAKQGSDRTAVIVEAELVGGECSYWACMPSKALLRPVELLQAARALPGVAEAVSGPVNLEAVLARRDRFTHERDDSSQLEWAKGQGIDVVRGRARLTGVRTVEVTASDSTTRSLHARHAVVVATGTTAAVPPVPGLADAKPWTSRDVTNLIEVPARRRRGSGDWVRRR